MMTNSPQSFWNVVSLGVPLAAAGIGVLLLSQQGGTGDFAGRLGAGVLFVIAMAIACSCGAAAAIFALARNEPRAWLSIFSLVLNLGVALPVVALLLRR
jgi:hypothetical protein